MKPLRKLFLLLLCCAGSAESLYAKAWRNIVPLHSTHQDVANLFNECAESKGGCFFSRGNEDVLIVFSGESGFKECPKSLPAGTVLLVEVKFRSPPKFRSFGIDKSNLKRFDPATPRNIGYVGYIDETAGLVIQTYKGAVLQLDYIAARRDVRRCPSYYESPRSFVQILIEGCCPQLVLRCPESHPQEGDRIVFSAIPADNASGLHWSITDGKIVAGQGSREITVDTTGLAGRTITATVEMRVGSSPHTATHSCSVRILPRS